MTRTARWWGWLRQRPLAADALLALALIPVQLGLWASRPDELESSSFPVVAGLTAVEMGFVVVRRRWLWGAVVGLATFDVGASLLGQGSGGIAFVVLAYTVAAHLPLRPALAATAVLWAPTWALWVAGVQRPPTDEAPVSTWFLFIWIATLALACFAIGRLVRTRRAYVTALEERARTAEANQRALAAQAVGDERRRIARELHDVVAHHVAVMGVLATGARRAAAREPAAADQALATIEETGRTVLREMRRLLDVLRAETEPAGELAPAPGLAGVEALVEQVREAGLQVALRIEGEPGPLEPGVALTVYRLVQEALTNVLKHAGPATAEVRVGQGEDWLHVEVFDTGRGPVHDSGGAGHGLVSMRERVAVYGGTLRTGPRPGGGFRVYAKIPADHLTEPQLERRR